MYDGETAKSLVFATGRLRLRAREHARVGDHGAAARALQAVLDRSPDDLEVALRLALHYSRSEQTVQAARTYLHAAEIYARKGQKRRALALFDQATKVAPLKVTADRARTWAFALGASCQGSLCALAHLHRVQGRRESGLALFELAVDVEPTHLATLRQLVDIEIRTDRRAVAERRLQDAATTLRRQGRTRALLEMAQTLLDRFPRNLFALRTLAHVHLSRGEANRALPHLLAMQKREPGNPDTLLELARIHAGAGERVQALAALERFIWVRSALGDRSASDVIEAALTRAQGWVIGDAVWQRELIELGFGATTHRRLDIGGAELTLLPGTPPPPPLSIVPRSSAAPIEVRPVLSAAPRDRARASAAGVLHVSPC